MGYVHWRTLGGPDNEKPSGATENIIKAYLRNSSIRKRRGTADRRRDSISKSTISSLENHGNGDATPKTRNASNKSTSS